MKLDLKTRLNTKRHAGQEQEYEGGEENGVKLNLKNS